MRDTRALAAIFNDAPVYVHIDGRLMTKPEVLADTRKLAPDDRESLALHFQHDHSSPEIARADTGTWSR